MTVTYRLAAWMLVAGGLAMDVASAETTCHEAIASGRAWELFLRNVRTQGGDVERLQSLYGTWRSPHRRELKAGRSGYIQGIDAYRIGLAGVHLGVGRNTTADTVSPDVGFIFHVKKGAAVQSGDVVAEVYGKDQASIDAAWNLVESALSLGDDPPVGKPLIIKETSAS
jgi:pyrimidine-nucleoside phosphorylase